MRRTVVLRQCVVKATSAKLVTSSYQRLPLVTGESGCVVTSCVVT